MPKKNILLVVVALILATLYVVYFTDWFRPKTVKIFHTSRNFRARTVHGGALQSLIFGLNRQLQLTEVRVVPAAAFLTNQNVMPVWHIISDSNSVPTKQFYFGQSIHGMKPAVPGARPQTLETNVLYHLILRAGKVRGEHDFELK